MSCHVCRLETKKRCGICRTVKYCSRKCQEKDWEGHRGVCAVLGEEYKKREEQRIDDILQEVAEEKGLAQFVSDKRQEVESCSFYVVGG